MPSCTCGGERMITNKIGCGSSTCYGHGDYAVCGEYYYDSIYICPSCELKQSNKERDTYRDLCAELLIRLSSIKRMVDIGVPIVKSEQTDLLITKAEKVLGERK